MQIETPRSPQPNSKIVFHGDLARFGEVTASGWTTADLLRASHHLRPGLRQAAANMDEYRIYVGEIVPGQEIEQIALWLRIPSGSTVHVVPVALGAKGRGMSIGKIAIGAAVVVGAIAGAAFTGGATIGAALGSYALGSAGFGLTWGALATFGALTMLTGVSGLISYHKKTDASSTNSDASTSLSGTLNVASQGQCVPLIYGRSVRVGSTVISSGYSAEDWANTTANADADKNNNSGQITSGSSGDLGAKGGKSGSSGGASEAPNTLRSKAVVRIIDLIGEGPGVSLVDGAKSIFFNGTPLMAADGTYNFKGVQWDVRTGDPDQDPVTGFPASESATTVGTEVKQPNPVIQSLTSDTATAARVTIRIPALYTVDTKTGVLGTGPDLGLLIEVRPSGGSWQTVAQDLFKGQKCTSDYQKSYRFDLPDSSSAVWDIRVTKTTPDSTDTSTACSLYFDAYDSISDHLMIYPNSAYVALVVDSAAFGSSVPSRTYDVTGKEVRIPANYDPVARTYATGGTGTAQGTWDGVSWKLANAVDDPTWCLLDLLGSSRYGYALPASQLLQLSYSLFTASQYASQQVDDGFGSTECRYALNVCINQDGDAYKVLQQFAGSFRAMAYWTNGGIDIAVDMPQEPVMLVTNANVIDGNFSYEGTGGNGRHNHCRVSFVNHDINSQTDYETYVDQLSVSAVGLRTSEIEGFGITSRGLARRAARWKVDTELHQTQTVTYKTGIDHAGVMPGDVVALADQYAQGARLGGRVWSGSTGTSVNLDSLFTPISGTNYTLKLIADDGSVATSGVKSFSTFSGDDGVVRSVAILTDGVPQPTTNTLWVLSEPTIYNTPQFMVLDNKETARGLYQITAIAYDPGKYGRVENNDPFNAVSFSSLPQLLAEPLPAPSNVVATDYTIGEGTTTIIRVEVGWTTPTSSMVTGSRVRAVSQATGETLYYDAGDASTYDIDGLTPGIWTFSVQTIGTNGRSSAFVAGDAITVDGKEDAPAAVLGLTVIGGVRVLNSTWQPSPIRNLMHYQVDRAPDNGGQPGSFSTIARATTTNFADTDHDVLAPNTSWWVRVAAVTTRGTVGAYCPAVRATTTYLITDDLEASIRNTAAYAQSLRDALTSPKLVDGVPSDTSGYPEGSVVANEKESGRLYTVKDGQWVPMITLVSIANDGKLTADQVEAVNSSQVLTTLTQDQMDLLQEAQKDSSLTSDQKAAIQNAISSGVAAQDVLNIISSINFNTSSLTAQQLADLNLANIAGQISGTQIQDGGITTPKLAVASVVAATLAAGSVTATALAVGSPANQIANSCFDPDGPGSNGWGGSFSYGTGPYTGIISVTGSKYWGFPYGVLQTSAPIPATTGLAMVYQVPSVTPGVKYCLSGKLGGTNSCQVVIQAYFRDNNGAYLSGGVFPLPVINGPWNTLDVMQQSFAFGVAPANTTSAEIRIVVFNPSSSSVPASTVACFSQLLFGQVSANVTQAPVWVPGTTTLIDGGNIKTGSLTAAKIAASSITGDKIAGSTITGNNIVGNSVSGYAIIGGTITGDRLSGSTITGDKIAGNTITTNNLAAGAVTTEKLSVGGSNNLVANSTFDNWSAGVNGWNSYNWGNSGSGTSLFYSGVVNTNSYGILCIQNYGVLKAGSGISAYYQTIPVAGDRRFCLSARAATGVTGLQLSAQVIFYDGSGNNVGIASTNVVGNADYWVISNMNVISCFVTSPHGTVTAQITLIAANVSGGDLSNGPSAVFTQVMLSEVPVNSYQIPPFTPGASTTIEGGNLRTGSIYAAKIAAGTITGDNIAGNSVSGYKITGGTISGDRIMGNTITAWNLAANTITAGQIAAGAIGADQIAAGSIQGRNIAAGTIYGSLIAGGTITGNLLAADSLIVRQAQIGSLVVGTSNLQDRSVTSYVAASSGKAWSISLNINCNQSCVGIAGWYAYSTGSAPNLKFNLNVNGGQQFQATGYGGTGGSFGINLNAGSNTVQIDFTPGTQPDWLSLCVFGAMK